MIKKAFITVLLVAAAGLVAVNIAAADVLSGKVLETMNSGGYTYVQVDGKDGKVWVAFPETKEKITVGKTMKFKPGMTMTNFESKSMKRTFDSIVFSEGIEDGKTAQAKTPPAAAAGPVPSAPSGKVIETMDSAGYTYIRINSNGKKQWVAVPALSKPVVKGQVVRFGPGAEMKDFESKTLKRKFDSIIFSDGLIEGGAKAGKKASAKSAPVSVSASLGTFTIAELFADKKKFNHKTVTVKGKVVKVSKEIMERNWYHLQDGSLNPDKEKGALDLMVTSQETAATGEEVVATGMFFEEKDFGSGYKFEGIIENATFGKSAKAAAASKDADAAKTKSSRSKEAKPKDAKSKESKPKEAQPKEKKTTE